MDRPRRARVPRPFMVLLLIGLAASLFAPRATAQAAPDRAPVIVLQVRGVVNPLTVSYITRGLLEANEVGAQLVVLTLDTPGGIETAMRDAVQHLLQAPVPVAVFVWPEGARATSAGLFIVLAGDVAAMAPATHIGAAHPVALGVELDRTQAEKMVSDAAAFVRSIAVRRGRNAEWAERAVRENLSLTSHEAEEAAVIDLVAEDIDDLLAALEGREISTARGPVTLQLVGAPVRTMNMNLTEQFMHVISDPNIAYLLLSVGALLLMAEFSDPGLGLPGLLSVVCFVLAFLALGSLPVNWAGLGLMFAGLAFVVIGLLTDTELVVSLAGLVPFVLGSLLLFAPFTPVSPAAPAVRVSPWLIGGVTVVVILFVVVVLRALLIAARLPPQSGAQSLIGHEGIAVSNLSPTGQIRVDQQDWSALSVEGNVREGERVRVVGVSGVRLQVRPLHEAEGAGTDQQSEDSA